MLTNIATEFFYSTETLDYSYPYSIASVYRLGILLGGQRGPPESGFAPSQ